MKGFALVLALALSFAPAAHARTANRAAAGCATPAKVRGNKGKSHSGCRRMSGPRVTVRSVAPMVAASLRAPDPGQVAPVVDPPAGSPPPGPGPAPARLGVVAREWSLVLSRGTLSAGRAIVQLQNFGEDAHNLRIERLDGAGTPFDVPLAESGELQSGQTTLAAGDYKIYCSLPGHDAQGMHARLTVTP
jgi:hypothetical protein